MKSLKFIILFLVSMNVQAQFYDDFSDGNFSSAPVWLGNTGSFRVNSLLELQLDTSINLTGNYVKSLYTNTYVYKDCEWNFRFKMNFSPSSSNYLKIFLISNKSDLQGALDGVFIRIGENGANDAIELYRQKGLQEELLIRGKEGRFSANPEYRIRVVFENNIWRLYSDSALTGLYIEEAAVSDTHSYHQKYFGLSSYFTKSNSNAFFFDDFYTGSIITDTTAPAIKEIRILYSQELMLVFDEILLNTNADDPLNFIVDKSMGHPLKATLQSDQRSILLEFASHFQNARRYTITVSNISDTAGNIMAAESLDFFYYRPQWGDLVINEFMADPNPPVNLPDAEFIELFNSRSFPVSIQNWKIADQSSSSLIDGYILDSAGYLILCPPAFLTEFAKYGPAIAVSLPSLNNSGDDIVLISDRGDTIDHISYASDLVMDGRSAERINPYHPCSDRNNWAFSEHHNGGSPGNPNSVYDDTPDTRAPQISKSSLINASHIRIAFDETPDLQTLTSSNFSMNCSRNITEIQTYNESEQSLILVCDPPFQHKDSCSLIIKNISDCWGNAIIPALYIPLMYIESEEAAVYDVIISELMADPDPVVELPPYEYIEIYNRSNKYIDLSNWSISDPNNSYTLLAWIIHPDSFLILCKKSQEAEFSKYGNTMGLSSIPALGNSEDLVFLRKPDGTYIHYISYKDSWYPNSFKKDGGWSLEIMDTDYPCFMEMNWTASRNKAGGSPGHINSVHSINPDNIPPHIKNIYVPEAMQVILVFSEIMDSNHLYNKENYLFENEEISVLEIQSEAPYYNRVSLLLNKALEPGDIHHITLKNISDCAGNILEKPHKIQLGMPSPVDSLDLIINEILFDPYSGSYDFVEIMNRSQKILDLREVYVSSIDKEGGLSPLINITEGFLIFPGDHVVVTENPEDIQNRYLVKYPSRMIKMNSLPSFNNDKGDVIICKRYGNIIDYVHYENSYHFALIDNEKGVSLERINPHFESNSPYNWHSASEDYAFATPTYTNSQYSETKSGNDEVYLDPKIFSPDGDGFDDVLKIMYRFKENGNLACIRIFDEHGNFIYEMGRNMLLGKEGFLTWDGIDQYGQKARIGVYIILVEINSLSGDTKKFKLSCTLMLQK
jgi:hypothetical protein